MGVSAGARRLTRVTVAAVMLAAAVTGAAAGETPGFALRDGDVVVLLGDSITAAQTYGKLIEDYTLLRFPGRKVRFWNAGKGGDTAEGGAKRLRRDAFDRGATVVIVAFGTNDIGWGLRADAEHKQKYLDGIREIARQCRRRGVRVYICSAAATAADPFESESGFFQKMCDEGMALARREGGQSIDVMRAMREVQKKVARHNEGTTDPARHVTLHTADGIHLNETGQYAMGWAILKGLGAPAEVSSATLDFKRLAVESVSGCRVGKLRRVGDRFEFTRRDTGLPINLGLVGHLAYPFVPIQDELNRYMLTVRDLPEGRYTVSAEIDGNSDSGRLLGTWTAADLRAGVNFASATTNAWEPGGPWDVQAHILMRLTESRSQLELARRNRMLYDSKAPSRDAMEGEAGATNARLERLQRETAAPRPYRFVIERVKE